MTVPVLTAPHPAVPPAATTASAATPAGTTPSQPTLNRADREAHWAAEAARLDWATPWHTTHSFAPALPDGESELRVPAIEWFAGGTLNAAVNCVDRHVAAGRGEKVALFCEGEPGDRRTLTYRQLQDQVCRAANALTALGIGRGDRVVIYLPVIAETIIITLAVARLGAIHSLVFGGFSAEALQFRVEDTGAKLLVTTDGQFRRGATVPVKDHADAAVAGANAIEHVLVVRRTGSDIAWTPGRDVWWHEVVDPASPHHAPEFFDAETPLFIMYTSGTTGQPKGLVHTTGGYLTQAASSYAELFSHPDPQQREADVHWCTADLAWVTAHTYEIYGPLLNGVTQVIYEGTPNTPHPGRHLEIIARYGVTSYYTAPTLVRSLMGWFPDGVPAHYDRSSVRLLGTVGEAVNPQAWTWLREQFGAGTVPVVDTWWQSETGATILSPRPTDATFKPGCAARVLPGLSVKIVDDAGAEVPAGEQGYIVVDGTGPAMARTVWGNPQRYLDSYWRKFAQQGYFLAGDGARYDADGDIWILGRLDDVINISGHRLSTIEIESALVTHPAVIEAGVTPVADPLTGHAVVAFVVVAAGAGELREELRAHVARKIGPIARPAAVVVVPDVPKTRSGKIMRRLLTQMFEGSALGDTTSLQNEDALAGIAAAIATHHATTGPRTTPHPTAQHTTPQHTKERS